MSDSNIESQSLIWTGERYLPEIHGDVEVEHLHRYLFAKQLSSGKRVLDIACGEGYGSALLAQIAVSVVGLILMRER
jgi:O-antigen biosynthesis protein